jgi:hypothetical protein
MDTGTNMDIIILVAILSHRYNTRLLKGQDQEKDKDGIKSATEG